MPVNFYEGKDNKPHRLFINPDRVTVHDRIVFAEAYYAVDDKCVSFYGILSPQSIGIENSKDKNWKHDSQKVLVSFHKDKKPTWNTETKKFEDKEVDPSENYLYIFAKDLLGNLDSDTISAVIAPYVNPQFLEDLISTPDEQTIAYWEAKVKNTIVATTVDSKYLNDSDKEVLKAASANSSGGKTYQRAETESEKLEARWEFMKRHLGEDYPVKSLLELGNLLAVQHTDDAALYSQKALSETLELIKAMWK